jgi:hypothetical protein
LTRNHPRRRTRRRRNAPPVAKAVTRCRSRPACAGAPAKPGPPLPREAHHVLPQACGGLNGRQSETKKDGQRGCNAGRSLGLLLRVPFSSRPLRTKELRCSARGRADPFPGGGTGATHPLVSRLACPAPPLSGCKRPWRRADTNWWVGPDASEVFRPLGTTPHARGRPTSSNTRLANSGDRSPTHE